MRPWMIAVAGAAGASLLDLLLVRPLVSSSLSILGLAGLSLYAMLAMVLSAGAFVAGLRRVRLRLLEAPYTPDRWAGVSRGTGFERLAGRILDVAPAGGAADLFMGSRPAAPSALLSAGNTDFTDLSLDFSGLGPE